jgi:hypothetical protein
VSFSDYNEDKILNLTLRGQAFAPPTPYVALFTSDPGEAGGGTEVSGGGYARQVATFGAPSGGVCLNSVLIVLGPATGAPWGTVTHAVIFDALSGGNRLYHEALVAPKAIGIGDSYQFAIGTLSVALD